MTIRDGERIAIMHFHASYAELTKQTADAYHVVINDRFRHTNALLRTSELLEMLGQESLVSEDGNPLLAEDVVSSVTGAPVGHKIKIAIVERAA
jgi:hypothetical protein